MWREGKSRNQNVRRMKSLLMFIHSNQKCDSLEKNKTVQLLCYYAKLRSQWMTSDTLCSLQGCIILVFG